MEISQIIVIFFCSLLILVNTQVPKTETSSIQKSCSPVTEKVTKLRFYLQDLLVVDNKTVWPLAKLNITDHLSSGFGLLLILDTPVTSCPEYNSEEMGRMQGLVELAGFETKALVMLLNVVFTTGKYKGSTISILGRNPLLDEAREVPIVGGTGAFRMARGYAITRTHNEIPGIYGVFEYDVTIAHLDDKDDGLMCKAY